jgi:hypothetical protein
MNRWVNEVTHLCQDLGADCSALGNALVARRGRVVLRLTEFQNHYLVAIGVVVKNSTCPKMLGWVLPHCREPTCQVFCTTRCEVRHAVFSHDGSILLP